MMTSETTPTIFKRYPGPKPFTTPEQALFFGREREREDLVRLVNAERLVVLFGKSGLGKSSLLNAGLLPALVAQNKGWLPIPIRFRVSDGKNSPIDIIRQHLEKQENMQITEGSFLSDKSLWHAFKRHQVTDKNTKFFLLFDQFEEFFTYSPEQQRRFRLELADLLYTAIPQKVIDEYQNASEEQQLFLAQPQDVRVMISMRSDRLSLLHQFKDYLPAILNARYELKGLTPQQARQAIELPARWGTENAPSPVGITFASPPFTFETETVDYIVEKLSETQSQTEDPHVETVQLQLICQKIEEDITKNRIKSPVKKSDLAAFDDIFKSFYLEKVNELDPSVKTPSRKLMEEELISGQLGDDNTRRVTVDQEKLIESLVKQKISKENAEKLLNTLVDTHLLRREPNSVGGVSYEICHDTFLRPMLRLKRERENANDKVVASKQLRKFGLIALSVLLGTLLLSNFLTKYFAGKDEEAITKNINTLYGHLLNHPPQYAAALHLADSLYTESATPQYALLLTTAFYSYLNTGGYVFDKWTLPESPKNAESAFSADGDVLYLPLNNRNDTMALLLKTGKVGITHNAIFDQKLFEDSTYSFDNQWFAKRAYKILDCKNPEDSTAIDVHLTQLKTQDDALLTSPDGQIFELGFTKNNQKLVTLGQRDVKLWHFQRRIMAILRGHESTINTATFSPDGQKILSASDDGTARIWSLDGHLMQILRGHSQGVTAALYTPDGQCIVTISRDGFVKLWQTSDVTEKQAIDLGVKLGNAQFDKNGHFIVKPHEKTPISFAYAKGQLTKIGDVKDNLLHDWGNATAAETDFDAHIEDYQKNLKVYDTNGFIIAQLNAQDLFSSVQFSADGNSLVVVDGQNIIRLPMPTMIQNWLKTVGFHR